MRSTLPLAVPLAVCVPLALAACGGMGGAPQAQQASQPPQAQATGGGFAQALAQEYNAFADSERAQLDWPDQAAFRDKAQVAASGRIPAPEDPERRGVGTGFQLHPTIDIGIEQRAEAIQGRQRLMSALSSNAARNPQAAARAQVAYDCWVEQLEEGWQEDDIERCRKAFNTALAQLESRPVAAAPRAISEEHQVYFEFDKADLTPEGRAAVAAAARDLQRAQPNQVEVAGHTDRAGTEGYNQELSEARARTVAEELAVQGVPADRIRTQAFGESDPVVPTPDGVPQPQNRRAVIEYD